jgi:hypothetical protein
MYRNGIQAKKEAGVNKLDGAPERTLPTTNLENPTATV